jgi:diadenosine tetraphosphate (Ap4A) HIT family hydrolase
MPENDDRFSIQNQMGMRSGGGYNEFARSLNNCVFCDLRSKYILTEKNGMVATVNIFPYIDGQLLIIPRRHIEKMSELKPREWTTIFYLSQIAIKVLREEMGIEGVWMLLREGEFGEKSGKTVRHLHWNILPYNEQLNTWHYQALSFVPIDLATKLRPRFSNENAGKTRIGKSK